MSWLKQKWRMYYKDTGNSRVRMQLDLRKRLERGNENSQDPPLSVSLLLSAVLIHSVSITWLFVIVRPHKEKSIYRAPELTCDNSSCMQNSFGFSESQFQVSRRGNSVQLGSGIYLCPLNCGKGVSNNAIVAGRTQQCVGMRSEK